MVRLEEVFLANVVIYIREFKTIRNFCFANKKCYDAVQILRRNPLLTEYKKKRMINNFQEMNCLMKFLNVFMHLETIEIHEYSTIIGLLIPEYINQIIILNYYPTFYSINQLLQNKVIELGIIMTYKQKPVDLNIFTNLKIVRLKRIQSESDLNEWFTNKKQKFKMVRLEFLEKPPQNFLSTLNEFEIEKVIIVIEPKHIEQTKEFIIKLNDCILCTNSFGYDQINEKDVIVLPIDGEYWFNPSKENEYLESGMYLYQPSKMYISDCFKGKIDISSLNCLMELDCSSGSLMEIPKNITKIQSFHLYPNTEKLKEMCLSNCNVNIMTVPSKVSYLKLSECSCSQISFQNEGIGIKKLEIDDCEFELNINQIMNIRTLILNYFHLTIQTSFASLISLKKLSIGRKCISKCSTIDLDNYYPPNLIQLKCSPEHLPLHLSITSLTVLPFDKSKTEFRQSEYLNLKNYNKLKLLKLIQLSTDEIILPKKLKVLKLKQTHELYLNFSSLHYLKIITLASSNADIVLPSNIQTLVLKNCVKGSIINIEKISLKRLVILSSSLEEFPVLFPSKLSHFYSNSSNLEKIKAVIVKYNVSYESFLRKNHPKHRKSCLIM